MHANPPRIAIVGAGFGGLAMALELTRSGINEFVIFERAERVGGVWRENTYPGSGCDVPSPFYSFSSDPNPRWPWRYSKQDSILEYLEQCVDKYRLRDRIRLNANVEAAHFDAARNRWTLEIGGRAEEFDVLVCACGQLSEPATPRFAGDEEYAGLRFHSALWDHAVQLAGKRVGVIGTGASAIQFVPEIAPQAKSLHLFQRSAPFVIYKPDRQYTARHHELFERFPILLQAERLGWYLFSEYGQTAITTHPDWLKPWARVARWNMRRIIKDPAKREALDPTDDPGCKRLLFSKNYYEALARDNVELVTDPIARLTPTGIETRSGHLRELDVIIYGTGFQSHGFVAPMEITGRDGTSLSHDAWKGGARAYLGMTVPAFANMFLLYGPNTNLGGGSIVYMLESSARYVADAIRQLASRPGTALELRPERLDSYDQEIQQRLSGTAWASGCNSWYIDENGHNSNNWPGRMREYRARTSRLDPGDYRVLQAVAAQTAA